MVLGEMWNTKVIGNQIQWGQSASKNVYRAIDGCQYPSWGGMNVLMGNVIDVMDAPGNSASSLEGMNLACQGSTWPARDQPAVSPTWTVIGNNLQCEPATSTFTYADPLVVANTASTNVTNLASTGNQVIGNWSTKAWMTVPAGGTINHSTGI